MTCYECTHNTPTYLRECFDCKVRLLLSMSTKRIMFENIKTTTMFNQDELIEAVKARLSSNV